VTARDDVLGRIRAAHTTAPPTAPAYDAVRRDYRTTTDLDHEQRIELLVDRLVDYRALVRRTSPEDLAGTVTAALTERGARSVVVPAGLDPGWLERVDIDVREDGHDELSVGTLDGSDGVLTGCAVAIAETGTLVLDGSPDQGRRAITLVPDYHLCVVAADRIVGDVPEGLARLEPTRPLTFISGPSATSDIELNRVEGVHGPRTLEVIIVG
jgi:L-lactate dehydrogenase complex protein LldG